MYNVFKNLDIIDFYEFFIKFVVCFFCVWLILFYFYGIIILNMFCVFYMFVIIVYNK